MAQYKIPTFRQSDATTLYTARDLQPGPLQGFVPVVSSATVLTLNPSYSRLEKKSAIATGQVQPLLASEAITKQGILISTDEPITISGYPQSSAGSFRVDAIVMTHRYVSSEALNDATFSVIPGGLAATPEAAELLKPSTDQLPTMTLIGYVRMSGVSLITSAVEIVYADQVTYSEFSYLSNFVGPRELPEELEEDIEAAGGAVGTITGAVAGLVNKTDQLELSLKALLRKATPKGVIAWTDRQPQFYFDTTGRGYPGTEFEFWHICNGNAGTLNLAGRVVVGYDKDASTGLDVSIADDPDLPEATRQQLNYARVGNTGGGNRRKFTVAQMPSHNHGGVTGDNNQNMSHGHRLPESIVHVDPTAAGSVQGAADVKMVQIGSAGVTLTQNSGELTQMVHNHNVAAQGGGQTADIRMPYTVLLPIQFLGFD